MATKKCCSGCSGSNHCYGALNYVPGPYCGCRNYPYYTGPCAPVNCNSGCSHECECHHCCHHRPLPPYRPPWDCEDNFQPVLPDPNPPTPALPPPPAPNPSPTGAYGFFAAVPPVTVAAGGVVPLATNLANARYFTNNGGSILIRRAGTYLVTYTVQLSAGETAASQYYLALNGTAINESALNVTDDAAATETKSYTAQAIIQAPANSTLTLNSTNAVTLEATALNPYNLTIVRLA